MPRGTSFLVADVARIGRSGEASACAGLEFLCLQVSWTCRRFFLKTGLQAQEWRRMPETWKAWFWLASLASRPKATQNRILKIFHFIKNRVDFLSVKLVGCPHTGQVENCFSVFCLVNPAVARIHERLP